MSTRFTFTALNDQQDATQVVPRSYSERPVELSLRRNGKIARPIDLARKLKTFGLGLSDAHKALNRIVADEPVTLRLGGTDRATIIAELAEFGVAAE